MVLESRGTISSSARALKDHHCGRVMRGTEEEQMHRPSMSDVCRRRAPTQEPVHSFLWPWPVGRGVRSKARAPTQEPAQGTDPMERPTFLQISQPHDVFQVPHSRTARARTVRHETRHKRFTAVSVQTSTTSPTVLPGAQLREVVRKALDLLRDTSRSAPYTEKGHMERR